MFWQHGSDGRGGRVANAASVSGKKQCRMVYGNILEYTVTGLVARLREARVSRHRALTGQGRPSPPGRTNEPLEFALDRVVAECTDHVP